MDATVLDLVWDAWPLIVQRPLPLNMLPNMPNNMPIIIMEMIIGMRSNIG